MRALFFLTISAILLATVSPHARAQTTPAPPLQLQPTSVTPPPHVHMVNGEVYTQPTFHDIFHDYLRDSYGLPAALRTTVRALYAEGRARPTGWGTDAAGFGQRFGSSAAITVISGNVRFAMELTFHEDLRYLPCHHCSAKRKLENALLTEVTARHNGSGRRFFTLTPVVADFSGPIIAHTLWYPGTAAGPLAGTVSARTVFATRIGAHLFREFVLDRHPHAPPLENVSPLPLSPP